MRRIGKGADRVDGLHAGSFLRSDAADTATETITFSGTSSAPFRLNATDASSSWDAVTFQATTEWGDSTKYGVLGGDNTEGIMLRKPHVVWDTSQPSADIRLGRSDGTASGAWVNIGVKQSNVGFIGYQNNNVLTWGSANVDITNGLTIGGNTAWHSGNDGASSGLDADLLDGQHGSHYLNYNNFTNTPTIPTNNNQLTNGAGYVTTSGWTSSNDGSGSGLDADTLDGEHYSSVWYYGSTSYNHYAAAAYASNWFRNIGNTGLYQNSYGQHWWKSQYSHGTWQAHGAPIGGYAGMLSYYNYVNNLMYDSGGNGGVYQQNGAGWHFYFHRSNFCLGVATSTTNSSYELYLNGDLYATGNVVAYSDLRAKENIETIDNALDKVSKLRGVYYTWKKGERGADKERKEGKRQMGVIAQEILEVCPEVVVQETGDSDRYSVDYGKLTGILIEAVKDLKKEINELKSN